MGATKIWQWEKAPKLKFENHGLDIPDEPPHKIIITASAFTFMKVALTIEMNDKNPKVLDIRLGGDDSVTYETDEEYAERDIYTITFDDEQVSSGWIYFTETQDPTFLGYLENNRIVHLRIVWIGIDMIVTLVIAIIICIWACYYFGCCKKTKGAMCRVWRSVHGRKNTSIVYNQQDLNPTESPETSPQEPQSNPETVEISPEGVEISPEEVEINSEGIEIIPEGVETSSETNKVDTKHQLHEP